jgi:hypothetical protein
VTTVPMRRKEPDHGNRRDRLRGRHRDAENAGLNDIAQLFHDTMKDDSARAARAHELLKNIR